MNSLLSALRLLAVLSLLTGVLYPLAVWSVGHIAFRRQADGSLVSRGGVPVGSALLAQATPDSRYFQPRPSAADFGTVPSGASSLTWTSARLRDGVRAATASFRAENGLAADTPIPAEVVTASGSGLDPHLPPEAVHLQIARVAATRRLTPPQRQRLDDLVAGHVEGGQLSPARVNILLLNLALDAAFP